MRMYIPDTPTQPALLAYDHNLRPCEPDSPTRKGEGEFKVYQSRWVVDTLTRAYDAETRTWSKKPGVTMHGLWPEERNAGSFAASMGIGEDATPREVEPYWYCVVWGRIDGVDGIRLEGPTEAR